MAKILCSGDLHCYWPNYNRPGEDGTPSRLADWRRSADALVELAHNREVDVALFPGDYFPNSRPSPAQVLEVASLFARLEEDGVKVVGCAGNHDLLGAGQLSPVDLVGRLGPEDNRWGMTRPGVVSADWLQVAVLPSTKAVQAGEDPAAAAQLISQQLMDTLRALVASADPNLPIIVMGHWAISGSRLAAGNVLAATEPTLPLGDLQSLPIEAAIMGHIHVPQVIANNPLVLHTGVLERHDFGEEDTPCGCYIVDLDRQDAEFVALPARRFVTVNLTTSDLEHMRDSAPADELFLTGYEDAVRDAIVRVKYSATEELAKTLDHTALIEALYGAGAFHVAGIYPEIARSERSRESSVTETTGPLEALAKWLALRTDLSDEVRARVSNIAAATLKEVQTS